MLRPSFLRVRVVVCPSVLSLSNSFVGASSAASVNNGCWTQRLFIQKYSTHRESYNSHHGSSSSGNNIYTNSRNNNSLIFRAQRTLGMKEGCQFTFKDLRDAYFTCAKQCHPDLIASSGSDEDIAKAARAFLRISDAYEYLLHNGQHSSFVNDIDYYDDYNSSSNDAEKNEEEIFRQACWHWLGVSPEVVEESKKCPMFRQWLLKGGKSAETWLNFFSLNGGLAPRLRQHPKQQMLQLADGRKGRDEIRSGALRRRRRKDQ